MSTSYKLYYFNIQWYGEPIRWIFALAGQPFQDERVSFAGWQQLKPKMPMGQMPVLEVNGKALAQCKAIQRYLARQFGLVGQSAWEQARGDMISDYLTEFCDILHDVLIGTKEVKIAASKKFAEKDFSVFLSKFEKLLCENEGGDGFFVGKSVTWTDLFFVNFMDILADNLDEINKMSGMTLTMEPYPKIRGLVTRVHELPAIATAISQRIKFDAPF